MRLKPERSGSSVITAISLIFVSVGCGVKIEDDSPRKESKSDAMLLAMTVPNSENQTRAACMFELTVESSSSSLETMNVRNVHVLHKNAVSADRLKGSQNLTIQRTLTGAKDSRNESVAEFVDELNMLVGSANGDGVDAECIGAAKKLAAQFDERRKKIAEVKEKKSAAALSLSNDIYCDYDCGYRPPEYNYNSPYPYEFDYDKYGPTWAGGGGGYTDSFTNSFFNNYYGSYSSPDVLYAGSFGSIAGAAKNVYGRVDTADTLAGGCKDGTGIGGCIGGAAKAWMSGTLQEAAVNGGLMIMGASKFIPMVGTALTVFEPQPTGGSSMTDFCKTSFGANQDYCAYYRYEYR